MSNHQNISVENQVIALAGVAQAAALIDKLARTGYDDNAALKPLVYGLLQTTPDTVESVFIDRHHLKKGLQALQHLLQQSDTSGDNSTNYSEVMRLSLSMLHLQRKLLTKKAMLDTIGERLEQVKRQVDHFENATEAQDPVNTNFDALVHENVLANIASIYLDTLSTFRFRIQVNGNPSYLQQEHIVNKIRALLLCGIRAAILWQQAGGNRLSILLRRKHYARITSELLRLH